MCGMVDMVSEKAPRLMAEMKSVLTELTNLYKQENSSVCLKARTILIACDKPTYDIRYNFMEKMFLDGMENSEHSAINLQRMIDDESAIFDILGDFFYHPDERVRQAALEVYIRRAFDSYEFESLQHQRLARGHRSVQFQYLLPPSHPNRSYHNMRSLAPLEFRDSFDECQRNGAMAAFSTFDEFINDYETVLELFDQSKFVEEPKFGLGSVTPGSWDDKPWKLEKEMAREPTNILYIAVKVK